LSYDVGIFVQYATQCNASRRCTSALSSRAPFWPKRGGESPHNVTSHRLAVEQEVAMSPPIEALSFGNRLLIQKIRQRILLSGRAYMHDLDEHAAEQVRLLQSLDVVERVGDELRLTPGLRLIDLA
jgi:hypothetical protein